MAAELKPKRRVSGRVAAWEDDPKSLVDTKPVVRPEPALSRLRMKVSIEGAAPPAKVYRPGTGAFRYWTAADALSRSSAYWAGLLPSAASWHPGGVLPVSLDEGLDLNAYYDRERLCFFHAAVRGVPVYSGESPDVVTHELGHAVLDVARPELWDAATIEAAAFHESFGDISAMLSALQLESVREGVLAETDGRLYRSSRISRLAEQLGWAIRQSHPDAVDVDCLRNAVNSFFYRNPETLPPMAPASDLSSEPHSFSRVFTSAWLESLAGMLASRGGKPTSDELGRLTLDAGHLLMAAIGSAPITSDYFAQLAAQLMLADATLFNARYGSGLRAAFVRHGILSLPAAITLFARTEAIVARIAASPGVRAGRAARLAGARRGRAPRLVRLALPGSVFGLSARRLLVTAPEGGRRDGIAAAATDMGSLPRIPSARASRAFLEDLFRRGRVELGPHAIHRARRQQASRAVRTTHVLVVRNGDLILRRRLFDCGFDPA